MASRGIIWRLRTVSQMTSTRWYTMRYCRWSRRKVQLQDAEIIVSKKRLRDEQNYNIFKHEIDTTLR